MKCQCFLFPGDKGALTSGESGREDTTTEEEDNNEAALITGGGAEGEAVGVVDDEEDEDAYAMGDQDMKDVSCKSIIFSKRLEILFLCDLFSKFAMLN